MALSAPGVADCGGGGKHATRGLGVSVPITIPGVRYSTVDAVYGVSHSKSNLGKRGRARSHAHGLVRVRARAWASNAAVALHILMKECARANVRANNERRGKHSLL